MGVFNFETATTAELQAIQCALTDIQEAHKSGGDCASWDSIFESVERKHGLVLGTLRAIVDDTRLHLTLVSGGDLIKDHLMQVVRVADLGTDNTGVFTNDRV